MKRRPPSQLVASVGSRTSPEVKGRRRRLRHPPRGQPDIVAAISMSSRAELRSRQIVDRRSQFQSSRGIVDPSSAIAGRQLHVCMATKPLACDKKGIPKEVHDLFGLNLIFRIAVRKEQFQNLHNAFQVMRIINDVDLIEKHVPELMQGRDKGHSSKLELELREDDLWGDEDFELENEAESPLQVIGTPLSTDLNDNAAED
nr:replication factor A protein 1-like [Ipomoea batatas]